MLKPGNVAVLTAPKHIDLQLEAAEGLGNQRFLKEVKVVMAAKVDSAHPPRCRAETAVTSHMWGKCCASTIDGPNIDDTHPTAADNLVVACPARTKRHKSTAALD
jgi:hypothetical protein